MSCSPAPTDPCAVPSDLPPLSPYPLCPARGAGASSDQDSQTPPHQPSSIEMGLQEKPEQNVSDLEMQACVS